MKKALALMGLALLVVAMMASAAGANTGSVSATQNCQGWTASVHLDSNVTADHGVQVTTTIPGATGTPVEHVKGPQTLWTGSGATQTTGTVTLTIYYSNGKVEHQYTATLPPIVTCETTTTVAPTTTTVPVTTTVPATTSTTVPPKDTTTIFVTTSTTTPPVVTTVPPPGATTTTTPACTPGVPPSAYTGSNTKAPLAVAGVLLATGGAMILGTRRRRSHA